MDDDVDVLATQSVEFEPGRAKRGSDILSPRDSDSQPGFQSRSSTSVAREPGTNPPTDPEQKPHEPHLQLQPRDSVLSRETLRDSPVTHNHLSHHRDATHFKFVDRSNTRQPSPGHSHPNPAEHVAVAPSLNPIREERERASEQLSKSDSANSSNNNARVETRPDRANDPTVVAPVETPRGQEPGKIDPASEAMIVAEEIRENEIEGEGEPGHTASQDTRSQDNKHNIARHPTPDQPEQPAKKPSSSHGMPPAKDGEKEGVELDGGRTKRDRDRNMTIAEFKFGHSIYASTPVTGISDMSQSLYSSSPLDGFSHHGKVSGGLGGVGTMQHTMAEEAKQRRTHSKDVGDKKSEDDNDPNNPFAEPLLPWLKSLPFPMPWSLKPRRKDVATYVAVELIFEFFDEASILAAATSEEKRSAPLEGAGEGTPNANKDKDYSVRVNVIMRLVERELPSRDKRGLTRQKDYLLPREISRKDFLYMSQLGKGSFGMVCRVRHIGTGRAFAMKIINIKKAESQDTCDVKVKDERDNLRRVYHPFLTRLAGSIQTDRHMYLVMELIRNGNIETLIRESKAVHYAVPRALKETVARFYAAEVLLAIEALHKEKIIHRDIKPDNVLIDQDGHVRLTDLGVSFRITPDKPHATRVIGAHGFKAPEMLNGRAYGMSLDWWNFGILLYMLLRGKHPFQKRFALNTMEHRIKQSKFKSHKPLKGFSQHANDIVSQLLHPDPTKRLGALRDAEEVKEHPFFAAYTLREPQVTSAPSSPTDVVTRTGTLRSKKPHGSSSSMRLENVPRFGSVRRNKSQSNLSSPGLERTQSFIGQDQDLKMEHVARQSSASMAPFTGRPSHKDSDDYNELKSSRGHSRQNSRSKKEDELLHPVPPSGGRPSNASNASNAAAAAAASGNGSSGSKGHRKNKSHDAAAALIASMGLPASLTASHAGAGHSQKGSGSSNAQPSSHSHKSSGGSPTGRGSTVAPETVAPDAVSLNGTGSPKESGLKPMLQAAKTSILSFVGRSSNASALQRSVSPGPVLDRHSSAASGLNRPGLVREHTASAVLTNAAGSGSATQPPLPPVSTSQRWITGLKKKLPRLTRDQGGTMVFEGPGGGVLGALTRLRGQSTRQMIQQEHRREMEEAAVMQQQEQEQEQEVMSPPPATGIDWEALLMRQIPAVRFSPLPPLMPLLSDETPQFKDVHEVIAQFDAQDTEKALARAFN